MVKYDAKHILPLPHCMSINLAINGHNLQLFNILYWYMGWYIIHSGWLAVVRIWNIYNWSCMVKTFEHQYQVVLGGCRPTSINASRQMSSSVYRRRRCNSSGKVAFVKPINKYIVLPLIHFRLTF